MGESGVHPKSGFTMSQVDSKCDTVNIFSLSGIQTS